MEASEIHEFSEQVQEGGEKSMMYVSLIISVLAVLVAMVTVLGHREHTEAVLMQSRAADQWNEFQSHRIRQENVQSSVDLLALQPVTDANAAKVKIAEFKGQVAKWQVEINDESEKAKDLEHEVDVAEHKAARFDLGEALLQIAVVLASVTLLTKRSLFVLASILLGIAGLAIGASAYLPSLSQFR